MRRAGLVLCGGVSALLSSCGGGRAQEGRDGGVLLGERDAAATGGDGMSSDVRADGAAVAALLAPKFVTATREACAFSGPMAISSHGQAQVLLVTADGTFTALDPENGEEIWRYSLVAPAGQSPHLVAAPVLVGPRRVVFAWQDVTEDGTRMTHRVGVLDLEARTLDAEFPLVSLSARKPTFDGSGTVDFVPSHAYARSALAHARLPGRELGLVYVSYGNVRDLQPWHGWLFEMDLDQWRSGGAGAATTASLLTTADNNCGVENGDGARQMACGGGIWSPMGPQVVYDDAVPGGFQLLVPTGNGLLNPTIGNFANSVLRTGHGLTLDSGCDPLMCEPFDILTPGEACMSSCRNLFMPRLLPSQTTPEGPSRVCVGRTFMSCYAALDWDLGANSPAVAKLPGGPAVVVQPGKDGSLYLFDADHMGTLYDRAPIMAGCGEGGGVCATTWAGTIVSRPEIVTVDGIVLALIPTFVFDDVHPAGLQAVEISLAGGTPHLVPRWQAPGLQDPQSVKAFRRHAGGVTIVDVAGEPFAAVVDTAPSGQAALLYWVRVRDGAIVQRVRLTGSGQRFARPLALGDTLYVPSCQRTGTPRYNEGPSHLEAFSISTAVAEER